MNAGDPDLLKARESEEKLMAYFLDPSITTTALKGHIRAAILRARADGIDEGRAGYGRGEHADELRTLADSEERT